jgi:cell division protein FtsZ
MKVLITEDRISQENLVKILNTLKLNKKKDLKTLIFGVGGSGTNTLNSYKKLEDNVSLVVASGNVNKLNKSILENKIFLGRKDKDSEDARKINAGFDPSVGKLLAEENIDKIERYLRDIKLLVITGGMSGSVATGAIPVIVKRAKELDVATLVIVSKPFSTEGSIRKELAEEGVEKLGNIADVLIVYDTKEIARRVENNEIKNTLQELDMIMCGIISEIVNFIYNSRE